MALKESDFRPGQIDALIKKAAEQKAAKEAASETPTQKSETSEDKSEETATPEYLPPVTRRSSTGNRDHHHGPSRALAVRVVEHHPSVDPQPVKVMEGKPTSSEKIVKSVEHLEGSTKVGFKSLADIFRELFGSLKTLGRGVGGRGPGGTPPGMLPDDPGRATRYRAYGAEADQYRQYGMVWHEKVKQTYFTKQGLMDKMFDKNGLVGGYAHRIFERRRDENEYATKKLNVSAAKSKSLKVQLSAGLKDIDSMIGNRVGPDGTIIAGISEEEAEERRSALKRSHQEEVAAAEADGIIVKKSRKELRNDARQINKLRGVAYKAYSALQRKKASGYSKDALASDPDTEKLDRANIEIGKIDRERGKKFADWDDKKDSRGNRTTSGRGNFDEAPVDSDGIPRATRQSAAERPAPAETPPKPTWRDFAAPADPSTPLEGKRSKDAAQSSEESQEEARQLDQEFLDTLKGVERNTAPILDISKFLLGDKPEKKGEGAGEEKKGIFSRVADFVSTGPKEALKGGLERVLGKTGAKVAGRAANAAGGAVRGAGSLLGRAATSLPGLAARAAGGLASLAGGAGMGATAAAAAPWLLGGAAVLGGGYALYKGYQYMTGEDDPNVGPRGKHGRKVVPGRYDDKQKFINAYEKKHNAFPGTVEGTNDARSEAEMVWKSQKPRDQWYQTSPQNRAESLRPPVIPTSVPASPTVNAVSNVTNNSTKVIQPPTKPVNDDSTVTRYNKTRW